MSSPSNAGGRSPPPGLPHVSLPPQGAHHQQLQQSQQRQKQPVNSGGSSDIFDMQSPNAGTAQGHTSAIIDPQRSPWQAVSLPQRYVTFDTTGQRTTIDLSQAVSQQHAEEIRTRILQNVDRTYIHPIWGSREEGGQVTLPAPVGRQGSLVQAELTPGTPSGYQVGINKGYEPKTTDEMCQYFSTSAEPWGTRT